MPDPHAAEGDAVVTLTDSERLALSGVVHQNYYMPDVWAVVEQIIAQRLAGPLAVTYLSPGGRSLTRCCCDKTTARLVACPVHTPPASPTSEADDA